MFSFASLFGCQSIILDPSQLCSYQRIDLSFLFFTLNFNSVSCVPPAAFLSFAYFFTLAAPTTSTSTWSTPPASAFDTKWSLLAFGFHGKDYNAGTQETWGSGSCSFYLQEIGCKVYYRSHRYYQVWPTVSAFSSEYSFLQSVLTYLLQSLQLTNTTCYLSQMMTMLRRCCFWFLSPCKFLFPTWPIAKYL